jgi:hypothetical protein
MKIGKLPALLAGALLLLPGLPTHALDGVVVVNDGVAATTLDAAALKDIYTGKTMYWPGGQAITIVVAGDKADAALEAASGMNASAFKTHWQRLAFSGRGQQPKKVDDVAAALAAVAANKGAIAVMPAGTEPAGVKKIDVN